MYIGRYNGEVRKVKYLKLELQTYNLQSITRMHEKCSQNCKWRHTKCVENKIDRYSGK